jgi:hypothetical protein
MAISARLAVLLAKIENPYATDPTLTGIANAMLAKNIVINPMEGDDTSRELILPYMGNQSTIPTDTHVVITFETELAGSGVAGTAPAWGPLMRGCGAAEVIEEDISVTYTPITDNPESAYLKLWMGGTLHAVKGSRGSRKLTTNAQGIPVFQWKFWGLYVAPAEVAPVTPTYTAWKKPLVVNKANTQFSLNGIALVMRNFALDFNDQIAMRLLVNGESATLTDHNEQLDITVETVPVSTLDIYGLAQAQATVPVVLTHGVVAGNIATLSLPTAQLKRPTGYQPTDKILEWPLSLLPLPNAGNDQWSLELT